VDIYTCDVRDKDEMSKIILDADEQQPLDLVIANAGIFPDLAEKISNNVYDAFDINVIGVLNTIVPIIPKFIQRRSGHIALHSSLAAFIPQTSMPMYCASKASVLSIGENLRGILTQYNVGCTTICSGWIQSDLTQIVQKYNLPLFGMINIQDACTQIRKAIAYNRAIYGYDYLPSLLAYVTRGHTPLWKQHILDIQASESFKGWKDKLSFQSF